MRTVPSSLGRGLGSLTRATPDLARRPAGPRPLPAALPAPGTVPKDPRRRLPSTAPRPRTMHGACPPQAGQVRHHTQGPGPLTPGEQGALDALRAHRPAQPQNLILFTDPNKDPDDVATFVVGAQLHREGFVQLQEAAVTLGDRATRTSRAELAKGVFDRLGLPDVRVSVGRDYEMNDRQRAEHAKFLAAGHALRAAPGEVAPQSLAALTERLHRAEGKSSLLVIAGMTDAADLLARQPALVRDHVERIVIMGGVKPEKDPDGFVQPDEHAYNNTTDMAAARRFYRGAQEQGIPLRIVSKEAAYKAAVSPAFYEGLAQTGHELGSFLKNVQKESLKEVWDGIGTKTLDRDTPWFLRTFVSAEAADALGKPGTSGPGSFEEVWPQVRTLNLYDPLTLLAAVEGPDRMLFAPQEIHAADRSPVAVIGGHEVTAPDAATTLLSGLAKSALASGG